MKSDWSKPLKQSGNYFDLFYLIQNVSFWSIFKPLYLMDSLQYGWDNQLQYGWDNHFFLFYISPGNNTDQRIL